MHANVHQDSIVALSILKRRLAAEHQLDETTTLPLAWQPRQSWRVSLQHGAKGTATCRLPENELPLVTRAMPSVGDHHAESLSLEQVTDAPCTGAFPLGQLVRQTAGLKYSADLVSVRIEKAKNLLLNPHYGVNEIAAELGFESLIQFTRSFIRIVGESPQAYRARLPDCLGGVAQAD